jgi:hypothetical protein
VTDDLPSCTTARLHAVLADATRDLASIEQSKVLAPEQIERGRQAFNDLIDAVRGVLHNLESAPDAAA